VALLLRADVFWQRSKIAAFPQRVAFEDRLEIGTGRCIVGPGMTGGVVCRVALAQSLLETPPLICEYDTHLSALGWRSI